MRLSARHLAAGALVLGALPFAPPAAHATAAFGRCVFPQLVPGALRTGISQTFVTPDTAAWTQRCYLARLDGQPIPGTDVFCSGITSGGCSVPVVDPVPVAGPTILSCVTRTTVGINPLDVQVYANCTVKNTPFGTYTTEG